MIEWFRADLTIRSNEKFDELGDYLSAACRPDVVAVSSESRIAVGDVSPAFARLVAVGCVMVFFANVAEHRPDGDLNGLSESTLERWAGWEGARGAFAEAFMSLFVTDGYITGWSERQAGLIATQQEKEARRVAKRERDKLATRERRAADKPTTERRQIDDKPAYTNTNTNSSTSSSAREQLRSLCAKPERFDAVCESLLQGIGLPNMKPATAHDIEIACVDWLASAHATTDQPSPRLFRKFVEKIMQDRTTPQTGSGARRAPKLSPGKQAYINAGIALDALGIYDETTSSSHAQDTK